MSKNPEKFSEFPRGAPRRSMTRQVRTCTT